MLKIGSFSLDLSFIHSISAIVVHTCKSIGHFSSDMVLLYNITIISKRTLLLLIKLFILIWFNLQIWEMLNNTCFIHASQIFQKPVTDTTALTDTTEIIDWVIF